MTQTHDTAEDGFHEIQLSGKQLVFLFMATTVLSVLIFLCGVLVGRGARTDRDADQPVDTAAAEQPAAPADAAAVPPAADPPAPVPEPAYTYSDLQKAAPKNELKPQLAEPPPVQAKPPAPPAAAASPAPAAVDVPTSGRPGTWVIQVQALRNRGAASSIVQRLIDKGYPAFLPAPPKGTPAIYRVQIGRYKDRNEAERIARRLEKEEQFKPDIKR